MKFHQLLEKYNIKANINMLLEMWNEPHRGYHNLDHLVDLNNMITNDFVSGKLNEKTTEKLLLTALFHDIIYNPQNTDNELQSAKFFESLCNDKNNIHIKDIKQAIIDTQFHIGENYLSQLFNKYDMNIVEKNYESLLEWEKGIHKEYSFTGEAYKEGRLNFLESLVEKYPLNSGNLTKLVEYVKSTY
jgi:predicted metal-dependent HD superfamily phosphohydrolase